jgi:hypothetical protein
MMDGPDRDFLRSIISVALVVVPRAVKRVFAERAMRQSEIAQRQLAAAVTEAVTDAFDLSRKPLPPPGRNVPTRPD